MKNKNLINNTVFLIFVIVLLLQAVGCKEQTIDPVFYGSIEGQVLNEKNEGIANAQITTSPASEVLLSDDDGKFTFEDLEIGTYSVRAEASDFVTQLESVTVKAGETTELNFFLEDKVNANSPPSKAYAPMPENGTRDLDRTVTLQWSIDESDTDDELTFDVILLDANMENATNIAEDYADSSLVVEELNYDATYYWQVIAKDGVNDPVFGELWSFDTKAFPDYRYLITKETDGKFDIYSSDGLEDFIKLTNGTSSHWRPRLSPDRQTIAFISNAGIENHIYTMNRDGSDVKRISPIPIAANNDLELDFAWSPNGEQILFMNFNKLYLINKDGTGLTKIADAPSNQNFSGCDWTEQENRIVVRTTGPNSFDNDIFLLNSEGIFIRKLVDNSIGKTGNPTFSVDGKSILYTKDISGYQSSDSRQLDSHIFILNVNTLARTDLSNLKPDGTNDLEPRFSPTGAQVIFTNTPNDGISGKNIYIVGLDGLTRTLLFEDASMPDWK